MIPTNIRPQSTVDDTSIEDALATVKDIDGNQHHVIKASTRKAYESKLRRLRDWLHASIIMMMEL